MSRRLGQSRGGRASLAARWSRSSSCVLLARRRAARRVTAPTSSAPSASTRAPTCASSASRSARSRKVTPQGDRVAVDFEYDDKYKVPADAKAVVVVAVGGQRPLRPAHPGVHRGRRCWPTAPRIPLERTAVPVELDRIFSSLNDLDVALGPKGANKDGALSRLLAVGADNLDGEGAQASTRPSPTSPRPWHPVRRPGRPVRHRAQPADLHHRAGRSDDQVAAFNTDLASVADQLAGEREELALALKNLAVALSEVASFVQGQQGEPDRPTSPGSPTSPARWPSRRTRSPRSSTPARSRCRTCSSPTTRPSGHARHPRQRRSSSTTRRCSSARCSLGSASRSSVCDQIDKVSRT